MENEIRILQEKISELENLCENKNQLLRILSHDVRSPLNALYGYSQILKDEIDPSSELHEFASNNLRIIKNLMEFVERVLNISKIDSNQIKPEFKQISGKELVLESIKLIKDNAKQKRVSLLCDEMGLKNLSLTGDELLLSIAIRNLLSNAVKFTPPNGQIEITAEAQNDVVQIIISDTGTGMSKDKIKKLLSDNNFSSQRGTNNEQGSGLGFKEALRIISLHQGVIKIKSTLNKGATVSIFLPIQKPSS